MLTQCCVSVCGTVHRILWRHQLDNESTLCTCNAPFHLPRPCSTSDRKRGQTSLNCCLLLTSLIILPQQMALHVKRMISALHALCVTAKCFQDQVIHLMIYLYTKLEQIFRIMLIIWIEELSISQCFFMHDDMYHNCLLFWCFGPSHEQFMNGIIISCWTIDLLFQFNALMRKSTNDKNVAYNSTAVKVRVSNYDPCRVIAYPCSNPVLSF